MILPRDALRRYPLFNVLAPDRLDAWLERGEALPCALGDLLFRAGTPGRHVYLVLEGRVRVVRPGRTGRESSLGNYGPGDAFGEYALLPPGLNTATCRAGGPGRLLRLPLGFLQQELSTRPEVWRRLKMWLRLHFLLGYLRDASFLGFMSAPSFLPLLDRFETMSYPAGCTIQAEGLGGDRWFVIRDGRVLLYDSPDERSRQPLELGPGDCFGEAGLAGGGPVPLAEAAAETTCLCLSRELFQQPLQGGAASIAQTVRAPTPAPPRDYPWVAQQEAADCGVAALAMVLRYHGRDLTTEALRQRVRLDERGASLGELQQAAASCGFRSRAVRVGPAQLAHAALPAIAHLEGDHYVVVYATRPEGLVVGDPAAGVLTLPAESFCKTWAGELLLLSPAGDLSTGSRIIAPTGQRIGQGSSGG